MPQRTDAQIIKALKDSRGMIAVAARQLGITRQTIYDRRKKSEAIRDALEEAREFTSDVAELKLFEAIQESEAWAVCFYLKCQAKDRGYVEKTEVRHEGNIEVRTLRLPAPESDPNEWAERFRGVKASTNGHSVNGK